MNYRTLVPSILLAIVGGCLGAPEPTPEWVAAGIESPTKQVLSDEELELRRIESGRGSRQMGFRSTW